MKRPHVLYLNSHDTGRYIQPYGHAVPTPNLQRLAEQGVLFRRAFCGNPTCSPSRACLLTGQHAHRTGMMGLCHRGFSLSHPERHWAHHLKAAGYRTEQLGAQHVAKIDAQTIQDQCGFDRAQPSSGSGASAQQVAQVIDEHLAGDAERPLYLEIGFSETHRTFPPAAPADDPRYNRPPTPFPDTPWHRQDFADYCTMARQLDERYGRIFGLLQQRGLWDDMLIICTTDHGLAFPQMKCNLTDHGTGVLLLMKGPANSAFTPGSVVDALASHIDVYPTLCEAVGLDAPHWLDGHSLMPLVRGKTTRVRDQVIAQVNYHAAYEPMRSVRTDRYNYIRRFDERSAPVLPNCDESLSKDGRLAADWRNISRPAEMLFDVEWDPHETNNLVGRTDNPAQVQRVLDEMRGRLSRYMEESDDPIRHGPIMPPPEAVFNHPDQPSTADARTAAAWASH